MYMALLTSAFFVALVYIKTYSDKNIYNVSKMLTPKKLLSLRYCKFSQFQETRDSE